VITHPATRALVLSELAKRWSGAPDLLDRRRALVHVKIDTVRTTQVRAGGDLLTFAIDGAASEGVLGVYLASDRFLWASDRVQDTSYPSVYVSELLRAARDRKVAPLWTSGPHFGVIPWRTLDSLARK
jgi:hypothetical protein